MEYKKDVVLDKLFKISPVSINIIDLKTRQLVHASSWVVNHIGYSQEEFVALSQNLFEAIVHPEDRANQLKAYQCLKDDPSMLFKEFEIRFRKKNNAYVHVLVRISVLEVDEDGQPKMALNTALDISELVDLRGRLEEELKKMAIVSYKNAHELRGPVATILGLIQLIDYEGLNGAASMSIINALRDTVEKLDKVIGEISEHAG